MWQALITDVALSNLVNLTLNGRDRQSKTIYDNKLNTFVKIKSASKLCKITTENVAAISKVAPSSTMRLFDKEGRSFRPLMCLFLKIYLF